jgi:phage terminase large subunit
LPNRKRPSVLESQSDYTLEDLAVLEKIRPEAKKIIDRLRAAKTEILSVSAKMERSSFRADPVGFVDNVVGLVPTPTARSYGYKHGIAPQQIRVLEAIRDHKYVAVPAGHLLGKTVAISLAVIWFLCTHENASIITSAPTWNIVEEQIWREIRKFHDISKVPLPGKPLKFLWELGAKWVARGLSTNEGGKFRGFHSDYNMVIFDEATAVDREFYEEAKAMVPGEHDRFVLIGNPTDPTSAFREACDNPVWNVVRLSSEDHPNVIHDNPNIIPGAVTRAWVAERKEEYGGEDSPLYQCRVLGLWPTQSEDSLIKLPWVLAGQKWQRPSGTSVLRGVALGLDVGALGSDLSTLWMIDNGRATLLWWRQHKEVMETVGWVVREIQKLDGRALALAVDDTAIGNGVTSRLLELRSWARKDALKAQKDPMAHCAILRRNFSAEAVRRPGEFFNCKSEMWWDLRESLRKGLIGLPPDEEIKRYAFPRLSNFITQLVTPIYEVHSTGKIRVFDQRGSEEKSKKLPIKSPDIAHGLMLSNDAYFTLRPELAKEPAANLAEQRKRDLAQEFGRVRKEALARAKQGDRPAEFDSILSMDSPYSIFDVN